MTGPASTLLAGLLLAVSYFDAHNHFTGILPYRAYANLPAYVAGFSDPKRSVGVEDRLALYHYLAGDWYRSKGAALDDRLFSPADGQRFALGARAALVVFRDRVAGNASALDGTLERVLTATPWSEFDSAYAFRGGPASTYLRDRFYGGSDDRLGADLCKATVLELAATHIDRSEQSLPFIGGWKFVDGKSYPLETIECVMHAAEDPTVRSALAVMKKPMPSIKIVLMTHTAELGAVGAAQYREWSKTGTCAAAALPPALKTAPKSIYDALMGWNAGKAVVRSTEALRYFDDVVGIDTAAPETTCFTDEGMAYYERLADAVYRASKSRRLAGWRGKLLVHTHVGEGAIVDYAPTPPAQPWSFADTFASLPTSWTNAAQAQANVTMLLTAIRRFEREHPDSGRFVIFRLAHATWATRAQAQAMHDEGVEADVNLESNVATGAYPVTRMPLGATLLASRILPLAQSPKPTSS